VEQTTLLSESMSGSMDALREEDPGVGSGMGTSTITPGMPALAFDDGTEARDEDEQPKSAGGPLFSASNLPMVEEGTAGAEAILESLPEEVPEPVNETPTKILPPTFAAFDSDFTAPGMDWSPATASVSQTPPPPTEPIAPTTPAPQADEFEALLAGLDVGGQSNADSAASDTDDSSPGLTLTLEFDDLPPVTPPLEPETPAQVESTAQVDAAVEATISQVAEPPAEPVLTAPPEEIVAEAASEAVTNAFAGQARTIMEPPAEVTAVADTAVQEAAPVTTVPSPAVPAAVIPAADAGAASPRDDLGRLLRTPATAVAEAEDEPEPGARGARILGAVLRTTVVLGIAAGAGYGAWQYFRPTTVAVGRVSLPLGTDGAALMMSASVREKASAALTGAGVSAGELQNDALIRRWSEAAKVEGGVLSVTIPADEAQAKRLKSLLTAVSETAQPVRVSAAQAIAAAEEQLKAASAALASLEAQLSDAEAHLRDGSGIASLSSDVRDAEKERDQVAARLESLRSAAPVPDENAKRTLDAAVESFARQLDAARSQPTADQRLSAFAAAAQSIQEQGAVLMDEILRSRQEQAERLLSLRKRLDERMRIRQQQAWDSDGELKNLTGQLETARRALAAAREKNDATATEDLGGEVEYLEGLVKSRRALIGQDKGDQRALAEVQSIIEEQAQATEQDRKRLADSFEQMRQSLLKAMPEAGTLPEAERELASNLERRLNELQTARTSLADAQAAAMARHQESVKQLESELAVADARLVEKGQAVELARQSLPSSVELTALRDKAKLARKAKENAERNLQLARNSESAPTLAAEITTSGNVQPHRAYYAGGAAFAAMVLLSPLLRSRKRDELAE
jgi:hypothetical protein